MHSYAQFCVKLSYIKHMIHKLTQWGWISNWKIQTLTEVQVESIFNIKTALYNTKNLYSRLHLRLENIYRRWSVLVEVEVLLVVADYHEGGGMNHITHSFHVTQNIQWSHRQLCLWNLTPQFSVLLWFLHLCVHMYGGINDVHKDKAFYYPNKAQFLLLVWKSTETLQKRSLRHTTGSRELYINSWEGRFFPTRKKESSLWCKLTLKGLADAWEDDLRSTPALSHFPHDQGKLLRLVQLQGVIK